MSGEVESQLEESTGWTQKDQGDLKRRRGQGPRASKQESGRPYMQPARHSVNSVLRSSRADLTQSMINLAFRSASVDMSTRGRGS